MLIRYNNFFKYTLLFLIGGFLYGGIEILFRGFSHISMLIAGGICFILIGSLNEVLPNDISLISQMVISSIIVTTVEFVVGLVVNVWLKLNVWDYSSKPYNILGQVCLLYMNIWFILAFFAILLDDYLRYFIMKEEKPHYRIL